MKYQMIEILLSIFSILKEEFWSSEYFPESGPNRLFLHARVRCTVNDLDFRLFRESVIVRRQFVKDMMTMERR